MYVREMYVVEQYPNGFHVVARDGFVCATILITPDQDMADAYHVAHAICDVLNDEIRRVTSYRVCASSESDT